MLRCADPAASVEWYQNTLGLQPVRLEEFKAGQVPFPSVRVSPMFLIGAAGRVLHSCCRPCSSPCTNAVCMQTSSSSRRTTLRRQHQPCHQQGRPPGAPQVGERVRNPRLHRCAVVGVETKRKWPAGCMGVTCVYGHRFAAAGFDHFCLVVQEHDIDGVRQQLAAAGIEAEAQFDGVVVKRFGAQGNASSIYIRDPGVC